MISEVWGRLYLILDSVSARCQVEAMGRIARVGVPDMPHHIAQRGNAWHRTFYCDDDYRAYLQLMEP
jgi:putative transposase